MSKKHDLFFSISHKKISPLSLSLLQHLQPDRLLSWRKREREVNGSRGHFGTFGLISLFSSFISFYLLDLHSIMVYIVFHSSSSTDIQHPPPFFSQSATTQPISHHTSDSLSLYMCLFLLSPFLSVASYSLSLSHFHSGFSALLPHSLKPYPSVHSQSHFPPSSFSVSVFCLSSFSLPLSLSFSLSHFFPPLSLSLCLTFFFL